MKNYTIRRAEPRDATAIIRAHVRSIREICSPDYTPEQIEAWAGRHFKEHLWHQTIDRDFVWVLELDSVVQGFAHLALMSEDIGEVMGLYLSPEAKGLGAGKQLLSIIKKEAVINGLNELQLHSTVTAKTFYELNGFKQSGSDTTVEMRGVAIPCYPMSLFFE